MQNVGPLARRMLLVVVMAPEATAGTVDRYRPVLDPPRTARRHGKVAHGEVAQLLTAKLPPLSAPLVEQLLPALVLAAAAVAAVVVKIIVIAAVALRSPTTLD